MKKILFLCLISLSFFACSTEQESTKDESSSLSDELVLKSDQPTFDQSPEAQKALRDFFNSQPVGSELELDVTEEGSGVPLGKVKITILCKYVSMYSGNVWGYGYDKDGNYYFFLQENYFDWSSFSIKTKTTAHKVDRPQCL